MKKEKLAMIDALEIEPLSDEELKLVEGGDGDTNVASCKCCCVGCSGSSPTLGAPTS
jgi:bacteriocin-like protein